MYLVALLRNKEGEVFVLYDNGKSDDTLRTTIIKEESLLCSLGGYKLDQCMITTDNVIAMKTRLKFRIEELKSLKDDVDYLGYRESLMTQIGLLTGRLIRRGVEVTNEIALQCYDYRQSTLREVAV